MFSPLLIDIIEKNNFPVVPEDRLEEAISHFPLMALFFPGDFSRVSDSNDVAVVLPELQRVFANEFQAVVADRKDERSMQRRFRFRTYPALVFLRNGEYLGSIERIRDWNDYLVEIRRILDSEASDPPPLNGPGLSATSARETNRSVL